jgi:hypothetical protein
MNYFLRLSADEMKGIEKKNIYEITTMLRMMLVRQFGKHSRAPYMEIEKFQLNLGFAWLQVNYFLTSFYLIFSLYNNHVSTPLPLPF